MGVQGVRVHVGALLVVRALYPAPSAAEVLMVVKVHPDAPVRMGSGPTNLPHGARVARFLAWDRYPATLWQRGDRLGVVWDVRPTWTDVMDIDRAAPTPRRSEWRFGRGPRAAWEYFATLLQECARVGV